jgi:glycine cleavage system pyridoxal-binding protein P
MCEAVGVASVDELLKAFPEELRLKSPLDLPQGLSEQELLSLLKSISKKNSTVEECASFLGAGAYNHYVPSVVDHILLRSEFYTAYTPPAGVKPGHSSGHIRIPDTYLPAYGYGCPTPLYMTGPLRLQRPF